MLYKLASYDDESYVGMEPAQVYAMLQREKRLTAPEYCPEGLQDLSS